MWDHSAMFATESFDSLWMEIEHSSLKFTIEERVLSIYEVENKVKVKNSY